MEEYFWRSLKRANTDRGGTKYPQTGGTGENTPFAVQSRKKERDNGHDTDQIEGGRRRGV